MDIFCKYDALVPLGDIIPHPHNANDHDEGQIKDLILSFETYGVRHPIICDVKSMMIGAGHGRLLAAKRAKMAAYPVEYQKFESPEQLEQWAIADNAVALQAELNFKLINERLVLWGPELNIKALAIKDFVLCPSELPEPAPKGGPKDKDSQTIECPNCGCLVSA